MKKSKKTVEIFSKDTICCNCKIHISEYEFHVLVENQKYCLECFFKLYEVEITGKKS